MRKFLIKVNGVPYEVEVEDAGQAPVNYMPAVATVAVAPAAAAAPVAAPAASAAPAAAAPAAPAAKPFGAVKTGSEVMKAPMPGTILNILVEAGQPVKKNQVIMVLEAMKMENEIVSPRDGVIAGFNVAKGASVNAGDLLFSLE